MAKQVTINKSFYDKMDQLENVARNRIFDKGEQIVTYAAHASPVDTGAYIESWSVVSRNAGGGRSRTSNNKPKVADKQGKREAEASRLRQEVNSIDPLEEKGFTLRNRAPHANDVERKHRVVARTKDRFR